MVDGNVERSLFSYVANNNASFNSFFKNNMELFTHQFHSWESVTWKWRQQLKIKIFKTTLFIVAKKKTTGNKVETHSWGRNESSATQSYTTITHLVKSRWNLHSGTRRRSLDEQSGWKKVCLILSCVYSWMCDYGERYVVQAARIWGTFILTLSS